MSYFDDNQERIIYGPTSPRQWNERIQSIKRKYYTKKNGTRVYVDTMSDLYLANALALAESKGLQEYIKLFKDEIRNRQIQNTKCKVLWW